MFELFVAAALILVNGVFALSELSIVSSRKPRLRLFVEQGRSGAATALRLAEDPGRFLSTVQIGITLIGILAGAFSGAALGGRMSAFLQSEGLSRDVAEIAGYGIVIGAITFLSVIIGELVPKHLALRNPERFACLVAPAMLLLSKAAAPVVWALAASTRMILLLLGMSAEKEADITDEEIRTIVAEAESAGVIESAEKDLIAAVMRLGDRSVRAVMTPRMEVVSVNRNASDAELRQTLIAARHSIIPVHDGDPDMIAGVVSLRDLVPVLTARRKIDLTAHLRAAPIVPDTMDALGALKRLREAQVPMVLVHDEFGHFEGLLTPADILDAIAGAFRSDEDASEPEAVMREDGSWLIAGWMPVDEMADLLRFPLPERRSYDTVAGLILEAVQRIPDTGEIVRIEDWLFEIVDLDGRRIDKVIMRPVGME